jgi:uncharacterized protein YaiL (DUF2058 family)
MAEDDLGAMVQGPASAQAPGGGGWQQLLSDPKIQAFALNAGLAMLTPGWGPQLGQVLGAGASGMKGVEDAQRTESQYQDAQDEKAIGRASREREAALNRDSRAEISNATNAARLENTQLRVAGMLERTRLTKQPQGGAENKFYQEQLKNASVDLNRDLGALSVTGKERDDLIKARALERLEEARQRGVFGPPGAAPQAGAPSAPNAAPSTTATPSKPTWQQLQQNPKVQELMQSRMGRDILIRERPDLQREILGDDLYNVR